MAFLTKSPFSPNTINENVQNSTSSKVPVLVSKSDQPSVSNQSNVKYSQVAKSDSYPKRNQGIIVDCADGISLTDYTCAIGDIVDPKNVLYSSRISNNRVCLYLSSKQLVDEVTDKFEHIVINNIKVPVRPLVAKLQKVIISNVAPPIPHYILQNALENLNIKCISPIVTLKAAINKEGYGHVLSSRRQTYIDPKDASKIPEFIKIEHDEISYYVYPSINTSIRCFACKAEGHIAKHCPSATHSLTPLSQIPSEISSQSSQSNLQDNVNKYTPEHLLETDETHANHAVISDENILTSDPMETEITALPPKGEKRTRLDTVSSEHSANSGKKTNKGELKITNVKKFKKIESKKEKPNLREQLQPAEKYLKSNLEKYPVNIEELSNFLNECFGKSNISEIAQNYSSNPQNLVLMLQDVHENISDRNLRSRINRILKRLNNSSISSSDDDSDESTRSNN
ncbi:hypothetical protein TKK_0009908 [Trichogramma kaykai]|uniref:CCHC-type domain-containing protein n=1 Tax=Trichogramma kaykai TaxID=54128 RepID=A0ABD2WNW2_9HYME